MAALQPVVEPVIRSPHVEVATVGSAPFTVPSFVKFMFLSDRLFVEIALTPRLTTFWIVPPEPAVVPVPVTLRPPLAPVDAVTPPVRLIVAPVLPLRLMPVPVSLIAPLKATVPPLRPETVTEWPALPVIGEAMLMLPLAAPERSTPSPPALETFTAVVVPTVAVVTAAPLTASPLVP